MLVVNVKVQIFTIRTILFRSENVSVLIIVVENTTDRR